MIFGKKKEEDLQEKQNKTVFFKRKNFKYGSTSTIFTIIFIAAVILLNVVLTAVNDKVTLGVDLTNTKTYNLSTATTKYLKTIKTNTTIYILADKKVLMASSYYAKTIKIIEKFEQTNSNITIKYINLDNNPTFASQYSGESLAIGDV
ncbi:MAG TPA: Gldg family protein, partial [Clostridia bacterium]|nr:Gldg family protein [Clostridia bacterium]